MKKQQLLFCILGIVINLIGIALYGSTMFKFKKGFDSPETSPEVRHKYCELLLRQNHSQFGLGIGIMCTSIFTFWMIRRDP